RAGWVVEREKGGEVGRGCTDSSGVVHELGSEWKTDDCYSCQCFSESISCCSLLHRPVGYDKEKCKEVFHKESCTITVVEKADPSKFCHFEGMVG
uniref:Beta-microseminoprotein n=1 Tax=Ornithorhynchus anatinus TaxID=9258 RepID=A0A6I8NUJ0_ORNAN